MRITDWPHKERPRERLLKLGSYALSNAELLAIFLRTGIRGKTALDLGRDLLNDFGSLRALMEAPQNEFCKHRGLGMAKYVQLQAVLELNRRLIHENLQQKISLSSPQETKRYLVSQLRHQKREVFACLFLDVKNQLLCFEELFYGSLNSATVYPREVVKRALQVNAASVIFSHNHPSGNPTPSPEDKNLTEKLAHALKWVDVEVLDHIIVGGDDVASFAELGLLAKTQ
jgi:DNA repair protein RadC